MLHRTILLKILPMKSIRNSLCKKGSNAKVCFSDEGERKFIKEKFEKYKSYPSALYFRYQGLWGSGYHGSLMPI